MTCTILEICPKEQCVYPSDHSVFNSNIREIYNYCPAVDMYFDKERQEEYRISKIPKGKFRMGQQKGWKR